MPHVETSEIWSPEEARKHHDMAYNTFYPAEHAAGRPHTVYTLVEDEVLVRENRGACVLRGYSSPNYEDDFDVDRDGPNYAGWARVYVECGRKIPAKWRAAFERERNSDNRAYAHALEVSINTYGVRWEDGLNIDALTREPIPNFSFWRRMADGHKLRTGHTLTGYLTSKGGISTLVRTCCTDDTNA